jgi:hypothetical protein
VNVPSNVLWFEVLLYVTLLFDAVTAAFTDRTPKEGAAQTLTSPALVDAGFLLLFTYFVFLAARRRKNWPRWVLLVVLVLSAIVLSGDIAEKGIELYNGTQIVSHILAAIGLYCSFTGDARGWFNA